MNKRIQKKIKALSTHTETVRDFTVQEAWDKVAEFLAKDGEAGYFVNNYTTEEAVLYHTHAFPLLKATKTKGEIQKSLKPVETEWPLWEHKIEPEEVDFYCQSCTGKITAGQDIDQDGECDRCFEGKNEMWAKELKHQDLEYMDSKI